MRRGFGPFFIMLKLHYEKHPVSAERKAELIKAGYKIVDARFAPAKTEEPEAKRRGRTKKHA